MRACLPAIALAGGILRWYHAPADKRSYAHYIEASLAFRSVPQGAPTAQITPCRISRRANHPLQGVSLARLGDILPAESASYGRLDKN